MKKFLKYLRIVKIDVLIYSITETHLLKRPGIGFDIQKAPTAKKKMEYSINDSGTFVHSSILFDNLNILKLIGKSGPAIGNCVTNPDYRGKSIYPYVINHIATEMIIEKKLPEVFIIVNSDNINSIRGIEKAGFKLHSAIKAKRFLLFYYNVTISS